MGKLRFSTITKKSQSVAKKQPQIILNDKVFRGSEEIYQFFNCEEICEDTTTFSEGTSFSVSEGSLESFLTFN